MSFIKYVTKFNNSGVCFDFYDTDICINYVIQEQVQTVFK